PDLSLQRLQARRLPIERNQPLDIIRNEGRRITAVVHIIRMFVAKKSDICTHVFLVCVSEQKLSDMFACVGEQHVMNKRYRRRRSFDVEQNAANVVRHVVIDRCAALKQTGRKFSSTWLLV